MQAVDPVRVEWFGVDGSRWLIDGGTSEEMPVFLAPGPDGIYDAPVKTVWSQYAGQDGATFETVRFERRDVTLGLHIFADEVTGRSWEMVDSAFRQSMSYAEPGELVVTSPQSGRRVLRAQLLETPKTTTLSGKDPHLYGYALLTVVLAAENPFWEAEPLRDVWVPGDGTQVGSVVVSNPTDRPLYPQWQISGPGRWEIPDHDLTADSRRWVRMPSLSAGETVSIDTNPDEETAVSNVNPNYWARMGGVQFMQAVPPHTGPTEVEVRVSAATSESKLMLRCQRFFTRPWGME